MYRGGRISNGKTGMAKKEQIWKMLSEKIAEAGITVARNEKSVGAKIARMEGEYKKAFDFVSNTGQGLMDDGEDITETVKKMCPYFYDLDPIMGTRASTRPLELFESEADVDFVADLDMNSVATLDSFQTTVELLMEEKDDAEEAPKKVKRPISLAEGARKKKKVHPAVELIGNLSAAVEKSASQKKEYKLQELAALNVRAEAESKIKSRELDIMEKKMEMDTKKWKWS